jgi:phosphopantetheine--protein transferase-like protein
LIGVDIIYLPRFKRAFEGKNKERLISHIYSNDELSQSSDKSEDTKIQSLAGRFAVKEAVIKASKGELNISDMKVIEVRQSSLGYLEVLVGRDNISCTVYDVSVSHDGDYVVGIAMRVENCREKLLKKQ